MVDRAELNTESCHCGESVTPSITPYTVHGGGGMEQLTYRCRTCTCAWTRSVPIDPETAAMQERADSPDPTSNGSDILGAMRRGAKFLRDVGLPERANDLEAAAVELEASRSRVWTFSNSARADDHPADFLHDESCAICKAYRQGLAWVRRSMLGDLRAAMGEAEVARPWTPADEWNRLLDMVRARFR